MVADEALLAKLLKGALAQLVERLLCKQDVIGSNPLGSTRCFSSALTPVGLLERSLSRSPRDQTSLHPVA